MSRTLIVTGTDTAVGKTRVATALLLAARAAGIRAAGYKPVASGCVRHGHELRNEDAEALLAASLPGLAYAQVNPYAFAPPIAPHLAAAEAGTTIDARRLDAGLESLRARAELVVVEGAGGWRVPLAVGERGFDFSDWAAAQGPVLLVVGLRLGCLNHALLSAESIAASGRLAGWVANELPDAGSRAQAMCETLTLRLGPPVMSLSRGLDAEAAAAAVPPSLIA